MLKVTWSFSRQHQFGSCPFNPCNHRSLLLANSAATPACIKLSRLTGLMVSLCGALHAVYAMLMFSPSTSAAQPQPRSRFLVVLDLVPRQAILAERGRLIPDQGRSLSPISTIHKCCHLSVSPWLTQWHCNWSRGT